MTETTDQRLWCRSCGTIFTPPRGCDCDDMEQPELRDAVPYRDDDDESETTDHKQEIEAFSRQLARFEDIAIRRRRLISNAAEQIDAILRGNHAGWDQTLSALRGDLQKEINNG
jgi:hypothetical protein